MRQLKEDAAVRLFDQGRMSSGYAASLLGMTRRDFLELLQQWGVPFARYTADSNSRRATKPSNHRAIPVAFS